MFSRFLLPTLLSLGMAATIPLSSASAQRGGERVEEGRRGHPHHRRGRLMRQLDLSDNQKAQLRAIRESLRSQRADLRTLSGEERRAAARALRSERRRLVDEVLTPAQRSELRELRAAAGESRRARRVEHMTRELSLSDAQALRVRAILDEAATARRAAIEDGRSPRALRERTKAAIEAVLTPDQQTRFEAMRAERREHRAHRRGGRRGGR
ncbi:MAG: Spy/CpxP family protein refolding chaperone [Myxococcota bacterium]